MKTLERFEKRKYDKQEHVLALTSRKRARASAESLKHRVRTSLENPPAEPGKSNHHVSDDEDSSATRPFGMSNKEDSQEECIIPDQQNLAEEIQELCTETSAGNSNLDNKKLLDNISEEFSSKEELGTPVSEKLAKIVNSLFTSGMEEEKFRNLNKKYKRPENCPHLSAPEINSEIWNENLLTANHMTDISLCKIQLLNVSAEYAVPKTCEKVIGRLGKYKMDLSKELLKSLIDALAFLGQAASDTNQLRRDIIRPRLPGWMRQLAKNVPNGSELLFGDDLNKWITQINNTNNALLKKPSHTVSYKPGSSQMGRYSNGKNTTSTSKTAINIQKTCIPPGKALLLGEGGTGRVKTASAGTQKSKYIKFQSWKFKNSLLRLGKNYQ